MPVGVFRVVGPGRGGRVPAGVGYSLTALHLSALCFPVIYSELYLPAPLWSPFINHTNHGDTFFTHVLPIRCSGHVSLPASKTTHHLFPAIF